MTKLNLEPRPTRRTRANVRKKPLIEERLLGAMEELLEKGHSLGTITIEELTEQAGMGRATFYTHFKDKGELVTRLMSQVTHDIIQSAGIWFENSELARPEDLHAAIKGIAHAFKKHQAIVAAINDLAPHDESVRKLYEDMMFLLCNESKKAVEAVQRRGLAKPQATPEVATILTWVNDLYLARFVSRYEGDELEKIADALGHITVAAIFKDR